MEHKALVIPSDFNSLSKIQQVEFYLANGLLIHPCYGPKINGDGIDPGKTPRWTVPHRLKASAEERLKAFSNGNPDDNVGLVPLAPHIRLDVDDRSEHKRGLAAFELLHPKFFGDNLRVRTANGWHFELYCPDVPPGQAKITIKNYLPGVSLEIFVGEGLNVISPPSVHHKGLKDEYQGIREFEIAWLGLLAAVRYKADSDAKQKTKKHSAGAEDWKTVFKGDLRTLDIVALASELGLYGIETKESREGYIVHTCKCPWRDEHDHNRSEEWTERDTSTSLLTAEGKIPAFRCLHGHCSDREIGEFLLYVEAEHRGLVDKFCSRLWSAPGVQPSYRGADYRIKGHDFAEGYFSQVQFPLSESQTWEQQVIYPEDSILHGYVQFAQKQTEGADCYILGSIMPIVSRLLARRVYVPFGSVQLYPNLFSILIGPPGDRKSFTIQLSEKVAAFCLPPEAFLTHRHSREGLVDEYDETCGGCPDKLYAVDDAASVLAHWKSQIGESLADTFLRLYDCRELSETYRRNKRETAEQQARRIIPVTSTSILFGATPLDATFPHQKHQQGLARRFLNYLSSILGRFIAWPETIQIENIAKTFLPLLKFRGPVELSSEAFVLWEEFQRKNRKTLKETSEERASERYALNSQPTHTLKVAVLFEACRAVFAGQDVIRKVRLDTLQSAIAHVEQCLEAGKILVGTGKRHETRQLAEEILAQIQAHFTPDSLYSDTIFVDRSHLVRKFCHDTRCRGSLQVDTLFLEIIPYLIQIGDARLVFKKVRLEVYAFRANYKDPDNPPDSSDSPDNPEPSKPGSRTNSANSFKFRSQKKEDSTSVSRGESPLETGTNSANSSDSAPISKNTHIEGAENDVCTPAGTRESQIVNVHTLDICMPACGEQTSQSSEPVTSEPDKTVCSSLSTHRYAESAEYAEFDPNFPLFPEEKSISSPMRNLAEDAEFAVQADFFESETYVYCAGLEGAQTIFEALAKDPSPCIALDFETYGKDARAGLYPHLGEIRLLTVALPVRQNLPSHPPTCSIFDLKREHVRSVPARYAVSAHPRLSGIVGNQVRCGLGRRAPVRCQGNS